MFVVEADRSFTQRSPCTPRKLPCRGWIYFLVLVAYHGCLTPICSQPKKAGGTTKLSCVSTYVLCTKTRRNESDAILLLVVEILVDCKCKVATGNLSTCVMDSSNISRLL